MISGNYLFRPDLDNFVLVYTMGKVGSTAIARSLGAVGIYYRHLQWLRPETQTFVDKVWEPMADDFGTFLNRLNVDRCRFALSDPACATLIKVITVVRAPIEQILSHYFHGLALFEGHLRKQDQDVTASIISANILECVDAYLTRQDLSVVELTDRLSESNRDRIFFHWIVLNCLNWIDEEFRPFFPSEIRGNFAGKGYLVAGNALILKFEELPTNGERAIAAYVQRPQFKLIRDNVGSERTTGGLYQQVLSTIRFPKEFVDHVCDSTYVRLLYTADERRKMKDRWTK